MIKLCLPQKVYPICHMISNSRIVYGIYFIIPIQKIKMIKLMMQLRLKLNKNMKYRMEIFIYIIHLSKNTYVGLIYLVAMQILAVYGTIS